MPRELAVLAEFAAPEAIERAVVTLREAGYARMEAFTPHPLPELEATLGISRSRVPRYVLAAGVTGAVFAFFLQYWLNGVNYPLNVGARPLLSAPSFIPITFETTVLFASLTAFAAWLAVSRLPTLGEPMLAIEGFSASLDRFWLAVPIASAAAHAPEPAAPFRDATIDIERCSERLREAGALRIVVMPEVDS